MLSPLFKYIWNAKFDQGHKLDHRFVHLLDVLKLKAESRCSS